LRRASGNQCPSVASSCSFVRLSSTLGFCEAHTAGMKTKELLSPTDPLGEALYFLRMSGAFYCRSEFTAPWGLELPQFEDSLMFHVVTSGSCWLEVAGAESCLLRPGEFALVPHGEGHRIAGAPGVAAAKLFDIPRELVSDRYEIIRHGGGGAPTSVVC